MTDQQPGSQITAALVKLQTNLPDVTRNQTGQVGPRAYKYADLAHITEKLLPELAALDLAWVTSTQVRDNGMTVLHYELRHTSGETIGGDFPITSTGTPQQIGAAITYGRRYCLQAVTGLATEEDTDGPVSDEKPVKRSKGKPPTTQWEGPPPEEEGPPPFDDEQRGPRKLTERQRITILAGFGEVGLGGDNNRDARLAAMTKITGRQVDSTNDLTPREAGQVIEAIAVKKAHMEREDTP